MSDKVQNLLKDVQFDDYIAEFKKHLHNAAKPLKLKCNTCSLDANEKLIRCNFCRRIFCDACLKNTEGHRCKKTLPIPILPTDDPNMLSISAQYGVDQCPSHLKIREIYCITCEAPLCASCLIDKTSPHVGHDMVNRAEYVFQCSDIENIIDFAKTIETHQELSARICLEELGNLKAFTERSAVIWLDFADRLRNFVSKFIEYRIAGYARAKAQHLLAEGVSAIDASANNRRLIDYLNSIKGADPESYDGVLAHNVLNRLKSIASEPAVLVGYSSKHSGNDVNSGVEMELFDNILTKFKNLLEDLAGKFNLSEESIQPTLISGTLTLQPLPNVSAEDMERNKEYVFKQVSDGVRFCEEPVFIEPESKSETSETSAPGIAATESLSEVKDYPNLYNLENGEHVLISSLKSPSDFHVNKLRNANLFQRINTECQSYGMVEDRRDLVVDIGMPLLALFSLNNRWYRARVLKTRHCENDSENIEVLVSYVDFGNKEWIPLTGGRLHSISSSLLSYQPQAIRCCLHNIVPASGERWSDEACEALENLFGTSSATVCICKAPEKNDMASLWQIDLYRTNNSSKATPGSFRDSLIFLGLGCFPNESGQQQAAATPILLLGALKASSVAYFTKSELKLNDVYPITIAHVDNPWSFYVHVLGEESNSLTQLNANLESYAKIQMKCRNRSMPPVRLGLPVIAPYVDGRFYRAIVLRRVDGSHDKVVVRYVDYGNERIVEITALLTIPEEFTKLPVQAVKFRLHAIKPNSLDSRWSAEACHFLKGKPGAFFDALIIGKSPCNSQYLVELFEADDVKNLASSIADAMINSGLAVPDIAPVVDFGKPTVSNVPSKPISSTDKSIPFPTFVPPKIEFRPPAASISPAPVVQLGPDFDKEPDGVEVVLTHCANPSDIYLRPLKLNRVVERIECAIKLLVDANLTSQLAYAVNGDLVCVSDDKDGIWKRGRVASLNPVTNLCDFVSVFLLDYGNTIVAKLSSLARPMFSEVSNLAEELFCARQTVYHCSLDGIKPAGIGGAIWSRKATETFMTFIESANSKKKTNAETWVQTGGLCFTDGKLKGRLAVRIFVKKAIPASTFSFEGRKFLSVSDKLIEEGVALSEIPLISSHTPALQLQEKTLETFEFVMSSEMAEIISFPLYALSLDMFVAKPSREIKTDNAESSCVAANGSNIDAKISSQHCFPRIEIFAPGAELQLPVKVKMASLYSVNAKLAIFHFVDKEAIDDVSSKCATFAENLPCAENNLAHLNQLATGTFVLAYETNCLIWTRAIVKDIEETSPNVTNDREGDHNSHPRINVYYIDLGHRAFVEPRLIRLIHKSPEADDLAFKPCAHFPVMFPNISITSQLANRTKEFVELLKNFEFTLELFAQLRDRTIEGVDSHAGVSAYLGQAKVSSRPSSVSCASNNAPMLDHNLGDFLQLQTLAIESASDNKIFLAYRPPIFNESGAFPVLVSHVNPPDIVWLQKRTNATEQSILKMKQRISIYAEETPPLNNISIVVPGMPLLCCWPVDNGWYRAVATSVCRVSNTIHVLFMDYGNDDHIPLSCCRTMPLKMYSRVAPYAAKGRLSKECLNRLKSISFDKLVNVNCFAKIADYSNIDLPIFELLQDDPNRFENFVPLQ